MTTLNKKKIFSKSIYVDKSGNHHSFKLPEETDVNMIDINKFPENTKPIKDSVKGTLSRECDFDYDNKIISVFAFTDGKEKHINKLELPPPIDKEIYYGNIYLIAHVNNKLINFTTDEFNEFYDKLFDGFDDLNSDESWSEEEEPTQSDLDFIADDNEIIEEDSSSSEEEEFSEETTQSIENESNKTPGDDVSELSDSIEKTNKSSSESGILLKEWDIIEKYLLDIDRSFLHAPNNIKDYIYKFHNKNNEYLEEWFQYQINTSKSSVKNKYTKYYDLLKKYI